MHNSRGEYHLRYGVCKTRYTGSLTEEIAPSDDPSPWCDSILRYDMFGDIVHTSSSWICRDQLGDYEKVSTRHSGIVKDAPELAMQYAMMLPMNQAHTAVAGPPELIGLPKVAGTEPSTPRIEMA